MDSVKPLSEITPSGYGVMVYDPSPQRRTILYKGRDITIPEADLAELKQFVDDGMRFVKIEGTRWAAA